MHNQDNKKVRLGIDAKWFFNGPPSGHMVVKNLVTEMLYNNNDRFEIYLIMNHKDELKAVAHFAPDTKIIFLPKMPNIISNALILPFLTRKYGLNVLMLQNFNTLWSRRVFKVVYIHDALFLDYPQYYSFFERVHFKQMKTLAKTANRVITISNTEKQRMINHHFAKENNIYVVYHGVNSGFKPITFYNQDNIRQLLNRYNLPEKYLLYVGRLNARKNLHTLIQALPLLQDTVIKLLIVGEQNDNGELLKEIEFYQLSDKIIFTGHVPEDDLHLIYAAATVFCFPSYAEGFGLPPLEAMRCGLPVVVSNRTCIPEICGDAAIYIDPDCAADIAKKINSLLSDNQFYQERMVHGIGYSAAFSWRKSAKEILNLITNAYADRKDYSEA
ncbi:glycosyltransferase family 4 protein [Mucilaginibacter sp.]